MSETSAADDIVLNPDQQAVALRHLREVQSGLALLAQQLQKQEPLSPELTRNVLGVAEYELCDLAQTLGVATDTTARIEERHAQLRTANLRIRALEAQLGQAQSPELTQAALKILEARLNEWWDLEGFGHISELSFGPYGCRARFSCHLFGDFSLTRSETPVSDKERKALWHADLRQRGFSLLDDGREVELADLDSCRQALIALFRHRLPTAKVMSFDNHLRHGTDFVLRDVTVMIYSLAEILSLPQKPAAE